MSGLEVSGYKDGSRQLIIVPEEYLAVIQSEEDVSTFREVLSTGFFNPDHAILSAQNWGAKFIDPNFRYGTTDARKAHKSNTPSLRVLRNYRGQGKSIALVVLCVNKILLWHGADGNKRGMSDAMIMELSSELFREYGYWKVAELNAFMNHCKLKEIYGKLSPSDIMKWALEYDNVRTGVLDSTINYTRTPDRVRERNVEHEKDRQALAEYLKMPKNDATKE